VAGAEKAVEPDPLRTALAAIDPDELTPREALEALYRLKAAAG
jgi:DNA mismatch repair protein MutS